jgi:putative tryptophan/tyrosine transport system substrate-binding protein
LKKLTVAQRPYRRVFLRRLAAVAAALGLVASSYAAYAQRTAPRHIGVLMTASWPDEMIKAFHEGLSDAGYAEGADVVIEWRGADGNYDTLPRLAMDLVQRKVDVIVASSTPAAQAARRATSIIPIVMIHVSDPVGSGLATSLAHPGANVTGLSLMTREVSVKRLQLLKEAVPGITRVAVMWNPDTSYHPNVINDFKRRPHRYR